MITGHLQQDQAAVYVLAQQVGAENSLVITYTSRKQVRCDGVIVIQEIYITNS